jgi:hypothetical protein
MNSETDSQVVATCGCRRSLPPSVYSERNGFEGITIEVYGAGKSFSTDWGVTHVYLLPYVRTLANMPLTDCAGGEFKSLPLS